MGKVKAWAQDCAEEYLDSLESKVKVELSVSIRQLTWQKKLMLIGILLVLMSSILKMIYIAIFQIH